MVRKLLLPLLASVALTIGSCSQVEPYPPLDAEGLERAVTQLEKPAQFAKLSLRSQDYLASEVDPKMRLKLRSFPNVSEECQAIAELDDLATFGELGDLTRAYLPTPLGSFDHISGLEWRIQDTNQVDRGDYGVLEEVIWVGVAVALLSFESNEAGLEYTNQIRSQTENCFDFVLDKSSYKLDEVVTSKGNSEDFSFSARYLYEDPEWGFVQDKVFQVSHFGSSVMIAVATSDQDSDELLGISSEELKAGLDGLPALMGEAISQAG